MFEVFGHLHFYFFTVRISDLLLVTAKMTSSRDISRPTEWPLINGHEQYSNNIGKLMHFIFIAFNVAPTNT